MTSFKSYLPQHKHLYLWDGQRTSIAERFLIMELPGGERRTVGSYLHGYCQLMALTLSKVTGLPVGVLIQNDAFLDEDGNPMDALGHAYCILEREGQEPLILDARGYREHSEMRAEYGDDFDFSEAHGDQALDFLKDWMGANLLKGFDPGEEDALIAYGQRLQELGVLHVEPLSETAAKKVESFEQPWQSWQSTALQG